MQKKYFAIFGMKMAVFVISNPNVRLPTTLN